MPNQLEHVDRMQKVRYFVGHEENLRMWGQLYVSATRKTVGGWLVNSWAESAPPYWQPQMHWFDRGDDTFTHAYLDLDRRALVQYGEDKGIDAERVAFIRRMTAKWEDEWLKEQS